MIGEFLYQLNPRDQVSEALGLVYRFGEIIQNAVTITAGVDVVPPDRFWVPLAMSVTAVPTAAVSVDSTRVFIQGNLYPAGMDLVADFWQPIAASAFRTSSRSGMGDTVIPPMWSVFAQANFSGAGAANTLRWGLIFANLPRGNVSIP